MVVGAAENESPRNSAVSSDSGIVLFQSSPEQQSPDYHDAEKVKPSHPCISPYVNSRIFLDARKENIRISASNTSVNSNADQKLFSRILSKLARHPWTESTEFRELWSDIPDKHINPNASDQQEQRISKNDGASISNVVADSNNDSSRVSSVLRKHLWTASTEFVELWTDIPRELNISQDQSRNRKWFENQNAADGEQPVSKTSEIFSSSWTESEKFAEPSSDSLNGSMCHQHPSNDSHQNKTECFCKIQSAVMNWRYHVLVLAMKFLLSLVPVSAIYMGAVYIGSCPANESATNLVCITGIAGLFLIGCHIANHFVNDWKEQLRAAVKTIQIITVILMILEMVSFYSMAPSFEKPGNYCDKIFYNYTYYMNFAAAGIVFLSVLQQCTSCKHQVENETS